MTFYFAKCLKAIKGNTPWQFILNQWTDHPEYFILNHNHFLTGLNIYKISKFIKNKKLVL